MICIDGHPKPLTWCDVVPRVSPYAGASTLLIYSCAGTVGCNMLG